MQHAWLNFVFSLSSSYLFCFMSSQGNDGRSGLGGWIISEVSSWAGGELLGLVMCSQGCWESYKGMLESETHFDYISRVVIY